MGILALNGWVLVIAGVGTILLQGYQPATGLQVLGMNTNAIGELLLIAMTGILWQAMRASGPKRMLRITLSVIYMLLALVLIVLGGSRGGAISLLATLLMFWLWKPTRLWGKLGLLILAAATISTPFVFSTVVRRFTEAEGGPLGGRILIWQTGWLLIREHLWGGVGIGNVSDVLVSDPGPLAEYAGYVREIGHGLSLHNPVLQILAETGLLGILLYLSVLGSAVWSFVRQYCRCRETGGRSLIPYFAVVSCVFVGVMLSWSKGGGMEYNPSYFLLLALLLLPSRLEVDGVDYPTESRIPDVGATEL
jgi:O-antigen ligase